MFKAGKVIASTEPNRFSVEFIFKTADMVGTEHLLVYPPELDHKVRFFAQTGVVIGVNGVVMKGGVLDAFSLTSIGPKDELQGAD